MARGAIISLLPTIAIVWVVEIVPPAFLPPRLHGRGGVVVALGDVLAAATGGGVGVVEDALRRVGGRVGRQGGVPGQCGGVVVGAVGVCAVEDGGFEEGVGGVLGGCRGGGGGGGG